MSNLGDFIRKLRIDKGLSQENVADELGISQNSYGKIERGDTKLNIDKMHKLADLFNVHPYDILNAGKKTKRVEEPKEGYKKEVEKTQRELDLEEIIIAQKETISALKEALKGKQGGAEERSGKTG